MKKYIGKRIIKFLIVLVGVSILSFLLIAGLEKILQKLFTPLRIQSYAGTD